MAAVEFEVCVVSSSLEGRLGLYWLRMQVSRKRAQRGLFAWLAIAALGLLLVAPTVSRTLAAMSPALTADAPGMGHGSSDTHPAAHQDPAAPHPMDACGYCTLMSHSPAVTAVAMASLTALPASLPVMALLPQRAPQLLPLDTRPRGPPLV